MDMNNESNIDYLQNNPIEIQHTYSSEHSIVRNTT